MLSFVGDLLRSLPNNDPAMREDSKLLVRTEDVCEYEQGSVMQFHGISRTPVPIRFSLASVRVPLGAQFAYPGRGAAFSFVNGVVL